MVRLFTLLALPELPKFETDIGITKKWLIKFYHLIKINSTMVVIFSALYITMLSFTIIHSCRSTATPGINLWMYLSQWEMMLHWNVIFHWLGTSLKYAMTILHLYIIKINCFLIWDCAIKIFPLLPLEKMAAISQTIFSDAFSWTKSFVFDSNLLKFVPKGPVDNNPTLV